MEIEPGTNTGGKGADTSSAGAGEAHSGNTRIAVHDVVGLLQNAETIDTITMICVPQLTGSQIYKYLAYYEVDRGEIDLLAARQDGHRFGAAFLLDPDVPTT